MQDSTPWQQNTHSVHITHKTLTKIHHVLDHKMSLNVFEINYVKAEILQKQN